ncbi:hypothetical protein TIFTF001_020954 [Ficus carica]|uniref:Uncharacterized protein n=1 Tax=Ficus carica TaxID=3494 RepID=A0AA88AFU1_FICCA|nr:hypothetical protein TIFTF001_020954 [Ficus carica]
MTVEVSVTLRCSDCKLSESLGRLDRWHFGRIAMSNNEMRSQTIFDCYRETKVVISVTGDSRFMARGSILISKRCTLLRSSTMWQWQRLRKLHERSQSLATSLSRARSQTLNHVRFSEFWRYGDGGGSPKLHDSFSGDMAMVATARGDWSFGEVAKLRSRGLNIKVTGEESMVKEDDDLDKLEEAEACGMAGDAEQTPTRKIAITVI